MWSTMWKENTATPPTHIYIFVFVNEVFNIVRRVFLLRSKVIIHLICCKSIHPPEKFLRPSLQNISLARQAHNKNENEGHQMKASFGAMLFGLQTLARWKKSCVKHLVFRSSFFSSLPIPPPSAPFEPFFLRTEFQPDRGTPVEKQFDHFELPVDRVLRVDIMDNKVVCL